MTKNIGRLYLSLLLCGPYAASGAGLPAVVFQPSHQTDTGENYNEAETCGAMVDYTMSEPPRYDERKIWSYF